MSNWRKSLESQIDNMSRKAAENMGQQYVSATQKVLTDNKYWSNFASSTTRRKSRRAPTQVARGAFRDTIDTYEMHDGVYSLVSRRRDGGYATDIVIERDRLSYILDYRPELWDYVLEELHLLDAYRGQRA